MHLHYGSFLLDEADFSKVVIKVDAVTTRDGAEVAVEPAKAEEFFKANYAACFSCLGVL
jgi:hypothetical protein